MGRRSAQATPNESAAQKPTTIRRQAAAWLMRIHAREQQISYFEHVRYLRWLARSPLHIEEMRGLMEARAILSDICLSDCETQPKPH